MRLKSLICALALALLAPGGALAAPVLMISVDGMRPADVLQAEQRGLKLPTLSRLVAEGTYATGVRNSLPTLTYPNHVTMITGAWPARHGVASNNTFDPEGKNLGGWYWYAEDIKVPTLWDAAHAAGKPVANLFWPVATGSPSIDWNVPEYWRARNPEDLKLLRALATPGLIPVLERGSGRSIAAVFSEESEGDEARAAWAAALIAAKHPALFTLHLVSLDHTQHDFGPGSPEAGKALERIDAALGGLIERARAAEPGLVVAVVSDHGFAPLHTQTNLIGAFAEAGLITLAPKTHKVKAWEAFPWGGSLDRRHPGPAGRRGAEGTGQGGARQAGGRPGAGHRAGHRGRRDRPHGRRPRVVLGRLQARLGGGRRPGRTPDAPLRPQGDARLFPRSSGTARQFHHGWAGHRPRPLARRNRPARHRAHRRQGAGRRVSERRRQTAVLT